MAIVTIEKPLREKLGDAGADSLVRLINQSHENQKNDILEFVEEKFERRLTQEIMGLEKRLIERIADGENKLLARIIESESRLLDRIMDGESKLLDRIIDVENKLLDRITDGESKLLDRIIDGEGKLDKRITSLETRIAEVRADLIKWMFIFWVGQVGMILGILFAFFK